MNEPIMIKCPYHPQKRFFKCAECHDIEVECELCKALYSISISTDGDIFRSEFKRIKKTA